jgi:hypothetical protein
MGKFDAGGDFTLEINIGEKQINLRALVQQRDRAPVAMEVPRKTAPI